MKKLLPLLMCGLLLFGCSDKHDDSASRNDENRVAKLEELCNQMNTNISLLQKIVEAVEDQLSISQVEQMPNGYIIHFSDGSTATIKNGMISEDAPIVGVNQDTDGVYCWTLNGDWMTDANGNKVKAQGTYGITPQLKIENDSWMLSIDDGNTWTDIGQTTEADITEGKDSANSIFKSVTEDDDNVYFTLQSGSVITISKKSDNSKFAIVLDRTDIAFLNGGESRTVSYTIEDATENTVVEARAQDGWMAKVTVTSTDKGTITITAPDPIVESEIIVSANDGSNRTVMVSLNCMQGQISIADNSVDAAPTGGTYEIKLTTNFDYFVEIPDDAKSWLSQVPQTRALREDAIVFEVAANEGIQRSATVALKDEQGNVLQTIIFRQSGTCTEVHVETEGELENVLADYDYANIESLKITGMLNDVDFLFIYNMMPKLKGLDIAEVNITALPTQAFRKSKNVENLILPNTLTTIGKEMFYNSRLKTVVIPANVTTIGESAFSYCSLISIDISASVETIEQSAFKGCYSLATVTFEKGSRLKTIGGGYSSPSSPSSPSSDHSYYYGAFSDCTALTSIEIPASVETIESSAFKRCESLATVTFEKGSRLKTIGGGYFFDYYYENLYYYGAFTGCTALTSIEIPASVETIEATAFKGCESLATVTFEKGSRLRTICGGYESYIGFMYYGVFSNCTALTSIEIPASVETIEATAFKGCYKLTTVTFEKGSRLKTIGGGCYAYSSYGAFSGCAALTSIEIPASVETIEQAAFNDCKSLSTVTFEKGSRLRTICGGYTYNHHYYGAFSDCTALTSIEIPASVDTIEAVAFRGCSKLTTVTFEEGSLLKNIGRDAFIDCAILATVDMSACTQVETLGEHAFYRNKELRLFKIGTETPPTCESYTFYGINPSSVLKVPSGCVDTYKAASGWKRFASITGLDE